MRGAGSYRGETGGAIVGHDPAFLSIGVRCAEMAGVLIIYIRKIDVKKYIYLSGLSMLLVCCMASAADNAKVDFTATISEASCEVTLPGGGTVAFGPIDPEALIGQSEKFSTPHTFNVHVKCTGLGPADFAPKLILAGEVNNATGAEAKKLFRTDAGSASKGFGVAIMPGATPDWVKILTNGSSTTITGDVTGAAGVDVPFVSAVACGTAADCAAGNLKAGSLAAAVTFTFAYK